LSDVVPEVDCSERRDKRLAWLYYIISLPDFHVTYKILFAVPLKHSSIWPLPDVKPMQDEIAHGTPW